eukprot:gene2208-3220_t
MTVECVTVETLTRTAQEYVAVTQLLMTVGCVMVETLIKTAQ